MRLLKETLLDTKPNVAKFLKEHVKDIQLVISNGKVQFWPTMGYQVSKVFVKFLDGHELIYYATQTIKNAPRYYFYHGIDELELKERDVPHVESFFLALQNFGFVPVCEVRQ